MTATLAPVLDLTSRLSTQRAYEAAVAGGPVRFVTRAFVEALQGAWGELPVVEPARVPEQRRASR